MARCFPFSRFLARFLIVDRASRCVDRASRCISFLLLPTSQELSAYLPPCLWRDMCKNFASSVAGEPQGVFRFGMSEKLMKSVMLREFILFQEGRLAARHLSFPNSSCPTSFACGPSNVQNSSMLMRCYILFPVHTHTLRW